MSDYSAIGWTDSTWNPLGGCGRVTEGCRHCYAERETFRLGERLGLAKYQGLTRLVAGEPRWTGEVRLWEPALEQPFRWRTRRRIFVNSMSDLFHDGVPLADIRRIFSVMHRADWHQFQILTKRADRLAALAPMLVWSPNIWMGVSVESAEHTSRIVRLQSVPAAIRFVSAEPLLGPIPALPLDGIHWVIVGGESGPKHRPLAPEWVRAIRDQCLAARVPFFFKQWGGLRPTSGGKLLDGREWREEPDTSRNGADP